MRVEPELPINPKYRRLKTAVGDVAMECLITIWAHCQQNQRGEFWEGADAAYVEMICNWTGNKGELFRALVECGLPKAGFLIAEEGGVRVHEWEEMNCQMVGNWRRNPTGRKTPAATRRGSPMGSPTGSTRTATPTGSHTPTPTATPTGARAFPATGENHAQNGLGQNGQSPVMTGRAAGSNDFAPDTTEPQRVPVGHPQRPPQRTVEPVSLSFCLSEAPGRIALLNELTGSKFNPPIHELEEIAARLIEVGGDTAGVDAMLRRQVALWRNDPKSRNWLKPGTLFGPNFHDYYGQREQPAQNTAPGYERKTRGQQTADRTELLETLAATRSALEENPGDAGLQNRVRELEMQTA